MTARRLFLALHGRFSRWARALRLRYYRALLSNPTLELYFPLYMSPLANISIGRDVAISAFVHIIANGRVTIGDRTIIASGVQITSSTHDPGHSPYRDRRIDKEVVIGSNVWIGAAAVILPGVRIGDNAIIGAGSIVTRDVPADTLVIGAPARPVRNLAEGQPR